MESQRKYHRSAAGKEAKRKYEQVDACKKYRQEY